MIVFNLKCANGHIFEEWFRSSSDYEDRRDAHDIACPTCGDHTVEKAVMAPRLGSSAPSEPACAATCPHGPGCPHMH